MKFLSNNVIFYNVRHYISYIPQINHATYIFVNIVYIRKYLWFVIIYVLYLVACTSCRIVIIYIIISYKIYSKNKVDLC